MIIVEESKYMPDDQDKKSERLCDLSTDELWELACEAQEPDSMSDLLMSDLEDELGDHSEEEDREPVVLLKKEELNAPEGKFRLVLHDMVPMIAVGDEPSAYHWGDFDSLDEAVKKSEERKPEYGTSYVVYDDKGTNAHENSAIPFPTILL